MSTTIQISMNGKRETQLFSLIKSRPEVPQNLSDAVKFLVFEILDKAYPLEE